ncbi:hypothetical protein [Streptomyces albipurpureus]|uniref:Uncharacterized protein n=1 Tax=Streptomyces albipurpureus TaxID=2897419 RepID=A0ABT0V1F3_9ACTN|nr:hypothetical protein [Streptomyces sp. CWNU-1]MCM2394341.1 hypothetical protein [Streptomyces sp. CWNU-1]
MSTTHHPRPVGGMEPYEGEYVYAEVLDDDHPGPRTDTQEDDRERSSDRWQGARKAARHAATAARVIAGQTLPGLRHGWAATIHWTTLAYMTDEEIRRRLVKHHLDTYTEQRDDTRTDIERLNKKAQKMAREAVDFGLTPEEAARLRSTNGELKRRARAGQVLAKVPFDVRMVQPTPEQIRRYRTTRGLGRFAGIIIPAGLATLGLVLAAPAAGLFALPLLAGAAWWLGHHPLALTQRALPADLVGPRELEPLPAEKTTVDHGLGVEDSSEEELRPFPIRDADTTEEAEEALRRAIIHEGGNIEAVTGGRREPWGWSARVVFASGSPDDLNEPATYKALITLLKLRRNGLLIEADPDHGDTCTVRMILTNPFSPELVGPVPYRAPRSMSIVDIADYGVAMDATPLAFSMAGLMLLMVADSGGGKSGVMLALGEVATACVDAAVINIDPAGTGIGDLEPAIALNACMDDDKICAVLDFLLAWCSARARQRAAYGWGNKWRVTREHPAICVFLDEWPQLSDRAKKLWIRFLLLGRKEALWGYGGSQYGTKDYLGEAIGPKLSAKMIGASRRIDVTELLGAGALAEGYRADLIQAATHTAINDAGQIYAHGLPGMPNKPMRYQVREISPAYAHRVATERAAGLPDLTHTLTEAGLHDDWNQLQKICNTTPGAPGDTQAEVPEILRLIHEAFVHESNPDFLTMDQIHDHLRKADPKEWGDWDDRDDVSRLRELGKKLSRLLGKAGVDLSTERIVELDAQPRGYYLAAVEAALNPPA